MRRAILLLILLFSSQASSAQSADGILGIWITENAQARVEIYKQSGLYFGKIVWVETGEDGNRGSALGTVLLSDMRYGQGKWVGTLYLPQKKQHVGCRLELVDAHRLKLTVSRFMGSTTKTWKRYGT